MSLISQYEILPQDEHRLNDYLLKQLQSKAKDIKTMTYDEQYKFYQTYFAKKEKGNKTRLSYRIRRIKSQNTR